MDYRRIITIEPGKRGGKPCIRGLRIAVQDVLDYLAGGMSEDNIIKDFPELTREDVRACLAFAADRERRLAGSTAREGESLQDYVVGRGPGDASQTDALGELAELLESRIRQADSGARSKRSIKDIAKLARERSAG